jgi:hypothetical protein
MAASAAKKTGIDRKVVPFWLHSQAITVSYSLIINVPILDER